MTFRDFVELVRDGLESLAFGLQGDRDLTPMLHLESRGVMNLYGIDPAFFESSGRTQQLVEGYVLPSIKESHAKKVAWTYCAWAAPDTPPAESPERREILAAVFIDAERVEHWIAPIVRTGGAVVLGPWESIENASGGRMINEIQEALR